MLLHDRHSGGGTYDVSDVMIDVLEEAVALGEGGPTVLHQVERPQLSKGGEKLLHLKGRRKVVGSDVNFKLTCTGSEHH